MEKDLKEKAGNLNAQKKQVKIELQELDTAARERVRLLDRIDGALELIESMLAKDEKDLKQKYSSKGTAEIKSKEKQNG